MISAEHLLSVPSIHLSASCNFLTSTLVKSCFQDSLMEKRKSRCPPSNNDKRWPSTTTRDAGTPQFARARAYTPPKMFNSAMHRLRVNGTDYYGARLALRVNFSRRSRSLNYRRGTVRREINQFSPAAPNFAVAKSRQK